MNQTLVVTQHVAAPPETAYAAWLSPEALATWWWVAMDDTTYQVDGRVDGTYRIVSPAAGIGVEGRFLALEPHRLIEMTWVWLDQDRPGPEEHVRVEFAPRDGGTLITVTHTVAPDGDVEAYRQGWEYVLGNLASSSARSVTLTQQVPAPRSEVYAAWLTPERLATWWWAGLPDTTYEVDARPGGRFRIRSESAGIGATGSYRELIEPERIVMSWTWETGDGRSPEDIVTVEFTDLDQPAGASASPSADTLVTLTHAFAVPLSDTSNLESGWADVLHALAEARLAAASPED
ncbi:SRPBCC family protein [Ornithinicoccus hortensis]|uniref:Uncharacterized protein YndB with AHSA1/START domain n=1 Tax=Ornithinicoccus hortensis TaxID=82346 RepID=A0A542YNX2_9MICO|nr:SRPBCC family protein [Ornithinicoccus hortensis]TQL49798.1 uncharacterized protein YndB with AHSA1/START domain [Ornithinicoccus hortensis]